MIKDSGDRHEFESGAVRDMQEGKGRCDLLPLDVVASVILNDEFQVMSSISEFTRTGDPKWLTAVMSAFCTARKWNPPTMLLEVSVHFEQGAEKYGENNWQKGLPVKSYINSAVRHYLKWLRGDDDEPHDRAFCWNILCAMWTCRHHPRLNNYAPVSGVFLNGKELAESVRKLTESNYGKGV